MTQHATTDQPAACPCAVGDRIQGPFGPDGYSVLLTEVLDYRAEGGDIAVTGIRSDVGTDRCPVENTDGVVSFIFTADRIHVIERAAAEPTVTLTATDLAGMVWSFVRTEMMFTPEAGTKSAETRAAQVAFDRLFPSYEGKWADVRDAVRDLLVARFEAGQLPTADRWS